MAGKVLDLERVIIPDNLGTWIGYQFHDWNMRRQTKINQWKEVRQYVYATDTRTTSNSSLPWKNTTTIPKLCQIRDNLAANYMASLFPKRKWLQWISDTPEDNKRDKREAIINYMANVIEHPVFKSEITKTIYDYIDYGNAIATVEWIDETQELEDRTKVGYIGPVPRRISPLDIVFNPIAESFRETPKIVKSIITMGELKKMLEKFGTRGDPEGHQALWNYMKDYRSMVSQYGGELSIKNEFYNVDGFDSYTAYLKGDYVELLTFYGDAYDRESDTLFENYVIVVADRHKVIHKAPNPSSLGTAAIRHVGWRPRQDNLWAMGPLDNLVGMQYRVDHVENLKADIFDLTAFPPLKVVGDVEQFDWGPFEKIFMDADSDVSILSPAFQALNSNIEIDSLMQRMEEMAGAPKEALGFRSPGEKTAYEVQRLENAASRIFQFRIAQFEEQFLEPLLNDLLELARRKMTSSSIRVFDDEMKFYTFLKLESTDISGSGRIRPVGARHFAEQAQQVQNITNFYGSAVGQDPEIRAHLSSIKIAKVVEDLLNLSDYEIMQPFVRLSEQADAARIQQSQQEQVMMEANTAAGLAEDDVDMAAAEVPTDMTGQFPDGQ